MIQPEEETYLYNVGQNIDRYRREQRMTLRLLSERTGIAKANLSPIMRGKKNLTLLTLKKIADALKVDVKNFLE